MFSYLDMTASRSSAMPYRNLTRYKRRGFNFVMLYVTISGYRGRLAFLCRLETTVGRRTTMKRTLFYIKAFTEQVRNGNFEWRAELKQNSCRLKRNDINFSFTFFFSHILLIIIYSKAKNNNPFSTQILFGIG